MCGKGCSGELCDDIGYGGCCETPVGAGLGVLPEWLDGGNDAGDPSPGDSGGAGCSWGCGEGFAGFHRRGAW